MTNIQDSQTRGMWEVGAIGPLQLKRVTQAIKALRGEQRTHIELTADVWTSYR